MLYNSITTYPSLHMRVLSFIAELNISNEISQKDTIIIFIIEVFVFSEFTLTVQGDIAYLTYTMILTQRKETTSLHIFLIVYPTLTAIAASNKSIMGYMHVVIVLASPSDKI